MSTSPAETPSGARIYDAEYAPSPERLARYADFAAIVAQLRRDCPWDREQTHTSVKHLLIEEAYEVVEAIEARDWDELKRELGDVLLHVLFHSQMAEEAGRFTIQDVIEAETRKLIRRHPHVFGEAAASADSGASGEASAANDSQANASEETRAATDADVDAVRSTWERIKQHERAAQGGAEDASVLAGVPAHLPSLLRALRVQEKAAGVGFDFPDQAQTWAKVEEEIREFKDAVEAARDAPRDAPRDSAEDAERATDGTAGGTVEQRDAERGTERDARDAREDELGDVLFALVNYARRAGLNPENALRRTTRRFTTRVQHIEQRLAEAGTTLDAVDLGTADALWDEAKEVEAQQAEQQARDAAGETSP